MKLILTMNLSHKIYFTVAIPFHLTLHNKRFQKGRNTLEYVPRICRKFKLVVQLFQRTVWNWIRDMCCPAVSDLQSWIFSGCINDRNLATNTKKPELVTEEHRQLSKLYPWKERFSGDYSKTKPSFHVWTWNSRPQGVDETETVSVTTSDAKKHLT